MDRTDVPTLDVRSADSNHIYDLVLDSKGKQDTVSFTMDITLDYGDDTRRSHKFLSIFPQTVEVSGTDNVTGEFMKVFHSNNRPHR